MSFSIAPTVALTSTRLLPRTGPRPLVPAGMLTAALGMALLTRIGIDTAYATHVLPSLILIGAGFGLILGASFPTATAGVPAHDSGVASAMVSTSQQIGGSIGTALLSTLAVSATTGFVTDHGPAPEVLRQAAVEGYTTAFWWAAGIFAAGALVTGALLRSDARPAPVHAAAGARPGALVKDRPCRPLPPPAPSRARPPARCSGKSSTSPAAPSSCCSRCSSWRCRASPLFVVLPAHRVARRRGRPGHPRRGGRRADVPARPRRQAPPASPAKDRITAASRAGWSSGMSV